MDPGRRKNEPREPEFVAVGETVIIDSVLWVVESFDVNPDDWAEPWHSTTFHLTRRQGDRTFTRDATFWCNEKVMVRNNLTSRS